MRTTVSLSQEALERVKRFQLATGLSLSEAVSELIERAERPAMGIRWEDGLPVADVPLTGKWLTNEDILKAQEELG